MGVVPGSSHAPKLGQHTLKLVKCDAKRVARNGSQSHIDTHRVNWPNSVDRCTDVCTGQDFLHRVPETNWVGEYLSRRRPKALKHKSLWEAAAHLVKKAGLCTLNPRRPSGTPSNSVWRKDTRTPRLSACVHRLTPCDVDGRQCCDANEVRRTPLPNGFSPHGFARTCAEAKLAMPLLSLRGPQIPQACPPDVPKASHAKNGAEASIRFFLAPRR